MTKAYPYIIHCKDCGKYHVPIPLEEFPVDLMEFANKLKLSGCPECDSTEMFMSQSEEAYEWYNKEVRND